MSTSPCPAGSTQLIAMHGWASDSRAWGPWATLAAERGWRLDWGERGYGQREPALPIWEPHSQRRIVLALSLIHI